jgi:hypothetical protein
MNIENMPANDNLQSRFTSEELLFLLLDLLSETCPYGNEERVHKFLPPGGEFDDVGNYIMKVGESKTLFACHMDTVSQKVEKVKPWYDNGWIYSKTKAYCLGGDDRCGMLCCIAMINANVPGTYIFHIGEERGTIGANHIASTYDLTQFNKAIEFDRRGVNSVITRMMCSTMCSDAFSIELANRLGMTFAPDKTGLYTDVYKYAKAIPEVTNVSVGYYNEHSSKEKINADWLVNELIPQLLTIDWETLPIERDPSKYEEDDFETFLTECGYYQSKYEPKYNHKDYGSQKYFPNDVLYVNKDDIDFDDDDDDKDDPWERFDREQRMLASENIYPRYRICSFCEELENTDEFRELEVDGEQHFLCQPCYQYLKCESKYRRKGKKRCFKALLPEFEMANQYSLYKD